MKYLIHYPFIESHLYLANHCNAPNSAKTEIEPSLIELIVIQLIVRAWGRKRGGEGSR